MKNFNELLQEAAKCQTRCVAVAVAHDLKVLEAIKVANQKQIAHAVLVGNKEEIIKYAAQIGMNLSIHKIIHETNQVKACQIAVQTVKEGKANMLMKGHVPSAIILKAVLDRNNGLRDGNFLNHIAVFEAPGYNRLFFMSDSGLNIAPNLEQKAGMINNCVNLARAINIEHPKVAVISGAEFINPDMTSSVDAAILAKMAERGQIKHCAVDGPLSLDLAISEDAVNSKGVKSEVAGKADILIMPNIEAANVLYKALGFLVKTKISGLIAGAKVPIIMSSRADDVESKIISIAMAVLLTKYNRKLQVISKS